MISVLALSLPALGQKTMAPNKQVVRALAPLSSAELALRERLKAHVHMLATTIGGRDAAHYEALQKAAKYIGAELEMYGYSPEQQTFSVGRTKFENIEAERSGENGSKEIVIVGAHYDTAGGLPGANDNGSGVAVTLELARQFAKQNSKRTIRWLFFANEELPYFQTPDMGSYVYAKRCRERGEKVVAMLSLETIGYYSNEPGSQSYPAGFPSSYPDRGNFLGFVADPESAALLQISLKSFEGATDLPATGASAPASVPGVGWSDHWSFWQFGYRALMLTDTAPYRYPYYHSAQDTPEKLDYDRLTRACIGIRAVVAELSSR